MYVSAAGARLSHKNGLRTIMDDIAATLAAAAKGAATRRYINLSIGNPANIPQVTARWQELARELLHSNEPLSMVSYGPSRGDARFVDEIIGYFGRHYGWSLTPENVVVGPGSQFLCFAAGVLFSGAGRDGESRPVVLPRLPDYTGYEGIGAVPNDLVGLTPTIGQTGRRRFHYAMRQGAVRALDRAGLMVVSTPSNPASQVVSAEDLETILDTATRLDATVVLDHAYGQPFPQVATGGAAPRQHPNLINCFSLSKAGLPGARVAFAIGPADRVEAMTAYVSNSALHAGRLSQDIATLALRDGVIDEISAHHIAPHYRHAAAQALDTLDRVLPRELNWKAHTLNGGMFLWLWVEEPWFDDVDFYAKAKERGVFVTPGRSFFLNPDIRQPWMTQCLRISLNQTPEMLDQGLGLIAACLDRAPALDLVPGA